MKRAFWGLGLVGMVFALPLWSAQISREQTGPITQVVSRLLERVHYRQVPFDDTISELFLTNYLDALDYSHMVFVQSDVEQFAAKWAKSLDDLSKRGDSSPAFDIFQVYLERLGQRNKFAHQVLAEPMDFNTEDTFLKARNKAPWPKDEAEAEQVWRGRVKLDLMLDRLSKLKAKEKKDKEPKQPRTENVPPKDSGAITNQASTPEPPKATAPADKPTEPKLAQVNLQDSIKLIGRRYDRLLKNMKDYETEEILQVYLSSLARAYDPHSDYLSPTEASDFDINTIKLKLSGIGARLRWEDGYTRVESLVPGGPAALSKQLKPSDRVIAVAQGEGEAVDVVEMPLRKVVELIRGPAGTPVALTVVPADAGEGGESKVIRLIRDEIKISEQFAKAKVIDEPLEQGKTLRAGVITLPGYYDNCAKDVAKLLIRLQKENVEGVVLDLRHNGGGLLEEAIELTGLFIPKGPVVQVRDNRRASQVYVDDNESLIYAGPLVVLVDHLSASASEITAAALQDYGRAVVVGDSTTHGKGTVQSVLSLDRFIRSETVPDPGKLKLTVQKFYRIAGNTTQQHGMKPDLVLPSPYDFMEIGEAHLPNCLPADEMAAAEYTKMNRVSPYVSNLSSNSVARRLRNQDFAYLEEDIARLKRQKEEKTLVLNENRLLKEQQEDEDRRQKRKQERSHRGLAKASVFDLTLDIVDQAQPMKAAGVKSAENEPLAAAGEAAETEDEAEEPVLDYRLDESVRILADYVGLLGKGGEGLVAAERVTPKP